MRWTASIVFSPGLVVLPQLGTPLGRCGVQPHDVGWLQNQSPTEQFSPEDSWSKNEGLAHARELNFNEGLRSVIVLSVYKRIPHEPAPAIHPSPVGCGKRIIVLYEFHDCLAAVVRCPKGRTRDCFVVCYHTVELPGIKEVVPMSANFFRAPAPASAGRSQSRSHRRLTTAHCGCNGEHFSEVSPKRQSLFGKGERYVQKHRLRPPGIAVHVVVLAMLSHLFHYGFSSLCLRDRHRHRRGTGRHFGPRHGHRSKRKCCGWGQCGARK